MLLLNNLSDYLFNLNIYNPSLAEHDMPCLTMPCLSKQCRSRSVGFWRSQLIWICTVCHFNLYQQSGSSNLIGLKLEMGVVFQSVLIFFLWLLSQNYYVYQTLYSLIRLPFGVHFPLNSNEMFFPINKA